MRPERHERFAEATNSGALRILIEWVRRTAVVTPTRVFAARAARRPELAEHADVAAVWAVLVDDREQTYPARDALARALLMEHRESGHALWSSVLMVAFYPMLNRLRRRLISDRLPRDELDHLVLSSFIVALAELPAHADRIAMRLRQRTERQVFAALRKERNQEHTGVSRTSSPAVPKRRAPRRRSPSTRRGWILRGSSSERLRSYVERTSSEDKTERERTYQRLKRQRTRALQRLRTLLGPTGSAAASL